MHEIFKVKSSVCSSRNPNDLQHYSPNQVTFGSNSLRSLGPQIKNGLPNEIKSAENLNSFKHMIKKWDGPKCKCNACQHVTETFFFRSCKHIHMNIIYYLLIYRFRLVHYVHYCI